MKVLVLVLNHEEVLELVLVLNVLGLGLNLEEKVLQFQDFCCNS